MVAKALEVLGERQAIASDIGCAFATTVRNSSLGTATREKKFDFLVNAFHGYSHNIQCQRKYHPSVFTGVGLRDFEGCERIFSWSNGLASTTRHSSAFRRDLMQDALWIQWDATKYANLGVYLLSNYRQALEIIKEDTRALEESKSAFNVTEEDMDRWETEQADFFSNLGTEPQATTIQAEYVELLQALGAAEAEKSKSNNSYLDQLDDSDIIIETPGSNSTYSDAASATMRLETQRRTAIERHDQLLNDVIAMECRLGITQRWIPGELRYNETLQYINERTYHRAIEKLHKLVIQRLFELHKLNIAGTGGSMFTCYIGTFECTNIFQGYKMRTHIAKALQTRSKAIRRAVEQYNKAAAKLSPPRDPLDWSKMSKCGYIEELTMLRCTRNDIRDKPWVKPVFREMLKIRHRIARAKEEIIRCNVETRRVYTAIHDEIGLFTRVTTQLKTTNSPLYGALRDAVTRRTGVNRLLLSYIRKIHALPGFTGERTRGTREGASITPAGNDDIGPGELDEEDGEEEEDELVEEDEELQREVRVLETFMSNLVC